MRIMFVGLNYAPEEIGIGPYSTGLVTALQARGHAVRVIAGKPYYPQWRTFDSFRSFGYDRRIEDDVPILRCPHYVPSDPNGPRRIAHHTTFAASALPRALWIAGRFRPDLVLTVAPSLIAAPVALAAARVAKAKSWLHVQDFEIEAAFATALMKSESRAGKAALRFQRRTLRAFDICSSISAPMIAKLRDNGIAAENTVEFRNWADIGLIPVLDAPSPYRTRWKPLPPKIVMYSGNIANKQGVGIIVEAAHMLQTRGDIGFVICGNGPEKARLIAQASGLPNIRFENLQPRQHLGDLLGLADIHLLPQLADAADLVLPSKLANMLASGRPVVATASPGTALHDEVNGCGIVTPPGDARQLANAITTLIDDAPLAKRLGNAARERAERRWTRKSILDAMITEVELRAKPA